jgi:hypothetical protein
MMRRVVRVWALAALMAAITTVVVAVPAMALDFDFDDNDLNRVVFFGNDNDDLNDIFDNDNDDLNDIFGNEVEQESESGDVSIGFDVSNTGRYASQCTPATQFGNTGNFQNGSSFVQGPGSELDDFEPGGIEVSFGGSQDVSCSNTIQQSSAASS